jgi:hypothetical protein
LFWGWKRHINVAWIKVEQGEEVGQKYLFFEEE